MKTNENNRNESAKEREMAKVTIENGLAIVEMGDEVYTFRYIEGAARPFRACQSGRSYKTAEAAAKAQGAKVEDNREEYVDYLDHIEKTRGEK
jgi:hypothetical protein